MTREWFEHGRIGDGRHSFCPQHAQQTTFDRKALPTRRVEHLSIELINVLHGNLDHGEAESDVRLVGGPRGAVLQTRLRGTHTTSGGLTQIKRASPVSVRILLSSLMVVAHVRLMVYETNLTAQAVPDGLAYKRQIHSA
jgi:hypothetical protein